MAPNDLKGHVALVTGGGSGIGRATCVLLARDGARVVVTDLNLVTARETVTLIPNPEEHLALEMDVTKKTQVESVFKEVEKVLGKTPTLLVNNAAYQKSSPCQVMEEELFDHTIDVNLKGPFLVSQAFINGVLKESDSIIRQSAIVNVASVVAKGGSLHFSQYAASKGGLVTFTKTIALEMVKKGMRVNCVLPGATNTPFLKGVDPQHIKHFMDMTPIGRMAKPEEIGEVIVFLLSGRSSFMVGACVDVSGGLFL